MLGNTNPFPLSVRNMDQRLGNARIKDLIAMKVADRDYSVDKYDFNIKALDTTNVWTVAAGGTATTWAVRAEAGGWIRGVTGTTTACAALQIYQPQKYWTGTAIAGAAFLWRSDVVQGLTIEMGFVDALPAINTTVINNATTPTFNTSVDVAMVLYQHSGNATAAPDRVGLYAANSSAATTQKSVITISTLGDKPGPAAATEHFVAIEVNGTGVYAFLGDRVEPLQLSAAVTAANGMVPFFAVKGSNSTSKNVDLDTVWTWSGRLG